MSLGLIEANRVAPPRASTIADAFSERAALSPASIAVIARERTLTYRELDLRSTQLAMHLLRLGVRPETLVGVAMERSETLAIALLAVLKAGAAYVPLDPAYPSARLQWIVDDSRMRVLLTTESTQKRLSFNLNNIAIVDADARSKDTANETQTLFKQAADGTDLAYVIYTSGSTGQPKGVMVENRNVVNFFAGMDQAIGKEPGVWLAVTSICFDISALELLWTLCRGFAVVISDGVDAATIADAIERHRVTHLQMTPSLARIMLLDVRARIALGAIRKLLLGGEAVPAALVSEIRRGFHGEIYNMYGPTETTVWSTTCLLNEFGPTVPIGKPIVRTELYILDDQKSPVTPGEVGELYIGGDGVARGYWNRPDLTSERFLNLPRLSPNPVYRTGDLVRRVPDGNLEFLGRVDYQIKLRGHRIETAEIEFALEQCAGVRQAVVVLREDRPGDPKLTAYLVGSVARPQAGAHLKEQLAAMLPEFMLPSSFEFLPSLPLTDNGKIDRKALLKLPPPAPEVVRTTPGRGEIPANEMEETVARIWQEALGVAHVGRTDNFFDLGAHSLTVAEAHAKLQSQLGREIALLDLFQFPTVRALAAHLDGAHATSRLSDRALRRRLARQL